MPHKSVANWKRTGIHDRVEGGQKLGQRCCSRVIYSRRGFCDKRWTWLQGAGEAAIAATSVGREAISLELQEELD